MHHNRNKLRKLLDPGTDAGDEYDGDDGAQQDGNSQSNQRDFQDLHSRSTKGRSGFPAAVEIADRLELIALKFLVEIAALGIQDSVNVKISQLCPESLFASRKLCTSAQGIREVIREKFSIVI